MDLFIANTAFCFTRLSSIDWNHVDYLWIIAIAVWTINLMAPIHCRGSMVSNYPQCLSKQERMFSWHFIQIVLKTKYLARILVFFWKPSLDLIDMQSAPPRGALIPGHCSSSPSPISPTNLTVRYSRSRTPPALWTPCPLLHSLTSLNMTRKINAVGVTITGWMTLASETDNI